MSLVKTKLSYFFSSDPTAGALVSSDGTSFSVLTHSLCQLMQKLASRGCCPRKFGTIPEYWPWSGSWRDRFQYTTSVYLQCRDSDVSLSSQLSTSHQSWRLV